MAENVRKARRAFQALFDKNDANYEIIYDLSRLTGHKQFASWIHDMWRLWKALSKAKSKNDLSVLYELFPHVREIIEAPPDHTVLIEQVRVVIKEEIKLLPKQLPLPLSESAQTGKTINGAKVISMPVFDEEDEVVVNRDQTSNTAQGFLEAALGFKAQEVSNNDGQ